MRPPVIMIHGAFCGGWVFDHWRVLFEERGYFVHAPDLRFHGAGKRPPLALGTTSVLDYAADLEADFDAFDVPPILIGHSMGGLLAQMLAARRPVAALVLLAPSAPWGVLPSTPFEIASAQALYLAGDFWARTLKPQAWIALANALDMLPDGEREDVFSRFVPESGRATFEIMHWPLDLARATQIDARRVTAPILCLTGGRDRVNPPGTVRRVAQRYRGRVVYRELPSHSHWLIGEPGWEVIAQETLAWLDGIGAEETANT
ncbi:MAG: alpha/beta fold hydrolase [Alphaproteobacteria bacterium]|nr:alpha/beta fold hydrolase [Alphaproteobacteria bacterium]